MNNIYKDLIILRWKYHQKAIQSLDRNMITNQRIWWCEYGAFVATLPRQSGKTAIIKQLTDNITNNNEADDVSQNYDFKVIVPGTKMAEIYTRRRKIRNVEASSQFMRNINYVSSTAPYTHLFLDEYQRMYGSSIEKILEHNWKSVSLFGTLIV